MADDWVDVPALAPPPKDSGGWVDVPQPGASAPEAGPSPPLSGPEGWSTAGHDLVNATPTGGIMKAFGQGFREASGPEPLGLSKESAAWLAKAGIFGSGGKFDNPFQAFNEGIIVPAAAALDGAIRSFSGVYRGLQAAGVEALPEHFLGSNSFGRDIVSLPDAFAGSPGALGEIAVRPGLPRGEGSAAERPPIYYHGTNRQFEEFDQSRLGSASGARDAQHGFYFTDDSEIATFFADNPKQGRVIAANLDIQNPKTIDLADFRKSAFEELQDAAAGIDRKNDAVKQAFEEGHDAVIFKNSSEGKGPITTTTVVKSTDQIRQIESNPVAEAVEQAKDLGVIGPERPPITEGAPKEVAERTVSRNADQPPGEKVTQEMPGQADPWQERFEGFVAKLKAPDDVKNLIRDAARENGDFVPARQGEISLGHVDDIAQAAGVDASEVNIRGLGRKLQNDNEVRVAMQMMLQVTDDVKSAARDVKSDGSPESMIKLQEAIMRRDLAVEQVVGLRAEWGRTGNVIQEFTRDVKDAQGLSDFLKGKGRTPADLTDIAHTIDGLDRGQAARLLNDMRNPSAWDKFRWYWVNSLISGPVTHAKYAIANTAFGLYESALVTPIAGGIGTARRAITGGTEGVFLGEAAARTWGIVAGVPDALVASVKAARTGMQTALPGELAQNIIPKNNKNLAFQQRTPTTFLGSKAAATAIGLPSRGASAIHSFFNFLGYRASIEAQAYRAAAKEGLSVTEDSFWQHRAAAADKPTPEMMNSAIEEGYRLTFINELGDKGRKMSSFVNSTKLGQLVMPFVHIPMNILKRSLEGTPAAFLDAETRETLAGKHGAVKQDMAAARMIAGGAVGAWAVNNVLNDRMTGYGPTDPKERAQWMATGHQPYSVRIGDEWYSFNRFGPLGTMLGLYSNLAEVIPHMKPDAEELTKAIAMTVHSTGRLMEDEVGMQGLAGLIEAINEPERKGVRFISSFAGSLMPYSSAQRQIASAMDPVMRETKSIVDGLRYYIPVVRQGLNPKRDWLGSPIANAGYGGDIEGAPGASALIQHRNAVADPVSVEAAALDLHPAAPQDRIKGVKLPPKLYDTYQATAGPYTRTALEAMINAPGWHDMPVSVRQEVFKSTIRATREGAAAAMQMRYPELIQQGVSDRIAKINGQKPGKLRDAAP